MNIMELLKRECKHDKVPTDTDICYCPDCGELIENQWFIVRCACCGVKHRAIVKHGKIATLDKFCDNCGAKEFIVERVPKINFIDINYAVLVKKIITKNVKDFTQTWVEHEYLFNPKLISAR